MTSLMSQSLLKNSGRQQARIYLRTKRLIPSCWDLSNLGHLQRSCKKKPRTSFLCLTKIKQHHFSHLQITSPTGKIRCYFVLSPSGSDLQRGQVFALVFTGPIILMVNGMGSSCVCLPLALAFVVQAQSCFNIIFETHTASGGFESFRIV